jgi:hypothetical protein
MESQNGATPDARPSSMIYPTFKDAQVRRAISPQAKNRSGTPGRGLTYLTLFGPIIGPNPRRESETEPVDDLMTTRASTMADDNPLLLRLQTSRCIAANYGSGPGAYSNRMLRRFGLRLLN